MLQKVISPRKDQASKIIVYNETVDMSQHHQTEMAETRYREYFVVRNSLRNKSNSKRATESVRAEYQLSEKKKLTPRVIASFTLLSPIQTRQAVVSTSQQIRRLQQEMRASKHRYISQLPPNICDSPNPNKILTDQSQSQYFKNGKDIKEIRKPYPQRQMQIIESPRKLPILRFFPSYINYFDINNIINLSNNLIVKNKFHDEVKHQHTYRIFCGKGNNLEYIKQLLRNRPFWAVASAHNDHDINLLFTQKRKDWYLESVPMLFETQCKQPPYVVQSYKHFPIVADYQGVTIKKEFDRRGIFNYAALTPPVITAPPDTLTIENTGQLMIHNHIFGSEYLDSKKELLLSLRKRFPNEVFMPTTYILPDELKLFEAQFNSKDVWIVKPAEDTNRGYGIKIMTNLKDIVNTVKQDNVCFVVQKYICNPLLYQGRKFDIRCYLLITVINSRRKAYWYRDGYVRTSSKTFDMNNLDSMNVHLTNDAIQNKCNDYGRFEKGNKLSLEQFDLYLKSISAQKDIKTLLSEFKELAVKSVLASISKLDSQYQPCFEIFGLDFMIDDQMIPYLIEFNTNPCYEMSCPILQKVIGRMLQNVIRLVIDPLFPATGISSINLQRFKQDNFMLTNNFEIVVEM